MDLKGPALVAKRSYLLNLKHFRQAMDNARNLYLMKQSIEHQPDSETIDLAITQENSNIEELRIKGKSLYNEYNTLTS